VLGFGGLLTTACRMPSLVQVQSAPWRASGRPGSGVLAGPICAQFLTLVRTRQRVRRVQVRFCESLKVAFHEDDTH
jgi:hypothetical protein